MQIWCWNKYGHPSPPPPPIPPKAFSDSDGFASYGTHLFHPRISSPSISKGTYIPREYALCIILTYSLPTGNSITTPLGLPFPLPTKYDIKSCLCYDIGWCRPAGLSVLPLSKTLVWNPTFRKCFSFENLEYHSFGFGFGFSAVKNDFKVAPHLCQGQHYDLLSAQDGCWKRHSLPLTISMRSSCFLDRTICWIAVSNGGGGIIGDRIVYSFLLFDCEREEFEIMEFPLELLQNRHLLYVHLFLFDGKLSILKLSTPCELWAMQDNTWSKLFTIAQAGWLDTWIFDDVFLTRGGGIVVASRDKQPFADSDWFRK